MRFLVASVEPLNKPGWSSCGCVVINLVEQIEEFVDDHICSVLHMHAAIRAEISHEFLRKLYQCVLSSKFNISWDTYGKVHMIKYLHMVRYI